MPDFVDEDHCSVCSRMWASEREAFRVCLDKLPLNDEPICDACVLAFWRNLGLLATTKRQGTNRPRRAGGLRLQLLEQRPV